MKRIGVLGMGAAALLATAAWGQPAASDNCADAPVVSNSGATFDLSTATNDGTATCGASGTNVDQWVKFTAGVTGTATFETCGVAGFDTVLAAFDACGGTQVACNDDACALQSRISFTATLGTTYYVRIAPFGSVVGGSGSITVTLPEPPPPGTFFETGDAGDLPAGAQSVTGTSLTQIRGNIAASADVDMYRIRICEPANFEALTDIPQNAGDTQLFLFNLDGTGIVFNDDNPTGTNLLSRLSNAFTSSLAAGDYLLAIARYNTDPSDSSAQLLWLNTPFDVERAPDGPGAANPVASWAGGSVAGSYQINLTGACPAGGGGGCVADVDDGSGSGTPDGGVTIVDLLYYLALFDAGDLDADVDNGTGTGTRDGGVTIEDLLYYLVRFDLGC